MTRLLNEQEVLHDLRTVGFYTDDTPTTTLSANEAAGQTVLSVTSETGFVAGDVVRIGTQGNNCDVIVVASVAAGTITAKLPTAYAHNSGASVTALLFVNMGHTTEDGVTQDTTQDETILRAGTQRGQFLVIPGTVQEQFSLGLLGFNPENLAQAHGISETDTTKVIAAVGITLDPNVFAQLGAKTWLFQGLREDNKVVSWYLANAKVATANVSTQFRTGEATPIPLSVRSTGHRAIYIE